MGDRARGGGQESTPLYLLVGQDMGTVVQVVLLLLGTTNTLYTGQPVLVPQGCPWTAPQQTPV
jgi:hypothetical protein